MQVWRMGRADIFYILAGITFWAHVTPRFDRWTLELAEDLDAAQAVQIRERLRAARSAYYGAFAGWGIPERAIRALMLTPARRPGTVLSGAVAGENLTPRDHALYCVISRESA